MTLRDYFAAAATEKDIQEFIPATCGEADQFRQKHGFLPSRQWARYCHADAMLKARGGQMSDTPKTNAAKFWSDIGGWVTPASKFMELERELNAANDRINRLAQAGDCLLSHRNSTDYHEKVREWDKAKKDKP